MVLVAALVAAAAAWHVTAGLERDRFEQSSGLLLRTAGERVVEMRGMLRAMVGMHYASDEFAGADIEAFAEQLRIYTPFVQSLGMVAVIEPALREEYERYAVSELGRERPVREWRIEPGADSSVVAVAADARSGQGRGPYWVIDSTTERDAKGARFIGTDLASIPALEAGLQRAMASGQGIAAPVPAAWPVRGDALLVQPVYLDERPPRDPAARRESLVGAVWMTLDLDGWLDAGGEGVAPGLGYALELDGAGVASGSRAGVGAGIDGRALPLIFGDAFAERTWVLGDSAVRLRVTSSLGVSRSSALGIGVASGFAALFALALLALDGQRRLRSAERAGAAAELERRAHRDPLTGCFNRFHFEQQLRELVDDARGSERRHALCVIDLDRFKIVNDTCGHPAGDRLLRELGTALGAKVRSSDVLARLGGDEFGILLRDVAPENARRVARTLHEHFRTAAFEHEGQVFPVRASIGVVGIGGRHADVEAILAAADAACYEAKHGGRDALVLHLEDDGAAPAKPAREETPWVPVLEASLDAGRIGLERRPVVAFGNDPQACGAACFEALPRLHDEAGAPLESSAWRSTAERHGLAPRIERRALELALDALSGSDTAAGDAPQALALSICGPTLADTDFAAWLVAAIAERGVAGERLHLLIDERIVLARHADCVALAQRLAVVGVRCTLDGFGAEQSSLRALAELPFHGLRFDRRWARGLDVDPGALRRLEALLALARAASLVSIVDGVDEPAVRAALATLGERGADFVQGEAVA